MSDDVAWLAGLSPWPEDGFGLERMNALLAALGDPQLRLPGRPRRRHERQVDRDGDDRAAAARGRPLGRGDGLAARPRRGTSASGSAAGPATSTAALAADHGRPRSGSAATQFETITAAALTAFADASVDVAVVEAGLGGRLRRDERAALAGRPAHERRARAHRRPRRHGRGDCDGEACCCPC